MDFTKSTSLQILTPLLIKKPVFVNHQQGQVALITSCEVVYRYVPGTRQCTPRRLSFSMQDLTHLHHIANLPIKGPE